MSGDIQLMDKELDFQQPLRSCISSESVPQQPQGLSYTVSLPQGTTMQVIQAHVEQGFSMATLMTLGAGNVCMCSLPWVL